MSEDLYTFTNTAKFLLECFDDCAYTKQDKMVVSNIVFKYINKNNNIFDSPKFKKFMYTVYEKIHEFEDIENNNGSIDNRTYNKFKTTNVMCKDIIETRLRKYCKEVSVKKILSGSTFGGNPAMDISEFPNVIKFFKKYEEEMEKERLKNANTKNKKPDRCVGGYNLRRLERKDYSKMF
jgi:hypothetical protein